MIPKNLKKFEKSLLESPPNEGTWECPGYVDYGTGMCHLINSGKSEKCWLCGEPKPKNPKLLWPMYLVACKKMEIEPKEFMFKFVSANTVMFWKPGLSTKWLVWGQDEVPTTPPKKYVHKTRRKA